uniref:Uncharacterized protein n=1 Tax=Opuntia streptacantha TaxID=393608 RepID=A0A7C9DL61_OPUST
MFFSNPSKQNSRVLHFYCCPFFFYLFAAAASPPPAIQSSNTVAACCCLLRHCISSPFLICQCNEPQVCLFFPLLFSFFFPSFDPLSPGSPLLLLFSFSSSSTHLPVQRASGMFIFPTSFLFFFSLL